MAITKLNNLVNPEVMAQMISATLPKKIKFGAVSKIDTTLAGQAGDTITVPKYAYIGDAEDVAEGVAMGTTVLTASTTKATVKKAGKAIEITDESLLSGYGDPMGEGVGQLTMSIASKVDNDSYDVLTEASLVADAASLNYDNIVSATGKFADETDDTLNKLFYIHPNQETSMRKLSDFTDKSKSGMDVVVSGTIGMVGGAQVVKSKRVKHIEYVQADAGTITIVADSVNEDDTNKHLSTILKNCLTTYVAGNERKTLKIGDKVNALPSNQQYYANPIVIVASSDPNEAPSADATATEAPAVTIYLKRNVEVEADRDILKKTTVASADEHYVAVLSNDSKVVLAKFLG